MIWHQQYSIVVLHSVKLMNVGTHCVLLVHMYFMTSSVSEALWLCL